MYVAPGSVEVRVGGVKGCPRVLVTVIVSVVEVGVNTAVVVVYATPGTLVLGGGGVKG